MGIIERFVNDCLFLHHEPPLICSLLIDITSGDLLAVDRDVKGAVFF